MGRIVINETENKQTIILNDSPEGVEGGYFDEEMVWHELGGEESIFPIEIKEGDAFFNFGGADWTAPHSQNGSYVSTSSNQSTLATRIHIFNDFASFFKIKEGDVLKITTSSPYIAVDFFTAEGYEKMKRQQAIIDGTDKLSTGWTEVVDNQLIVDSADYPGCIAIGFEFKKNAAGNAQFSSLEEVLPFTVELV